MIFFLEKAEVCLMRVKITKTILIKKQKPSTQLLRMSSGLTIRCHKLGFGIFYCEILITYPSSLTSQISSNYVKTRELWWGLWFKYAKILHNYDLTYKYK